MDYEQIRTFWPIIATVLNGVLMLVIYLLGRTFAKRDELTQLKELHSSEVSELKAMHRELETQLASMPDHKEFAALTVSMEGMRGDTKEIKSQLLGLERMFNLLLENELKEKS